MARQTDSDSSHEATGANGTVRIGWKENTWQSACVGTAPQVNYFHVIIPTQEPEGTVYTAVLTSLHLLLSEPVTRPLSLGIYPSLASGLQRYFCNEFLS